MTLDEKIERLNKKLDEYESKVGLSAAFTSDQENGACAYFQYDRQALESMSPEDCDLAVCELAQFGWHLRRSVNRLSALIKWMEDEQRITLGDFMEAEYGYIYGQDNKRMTAVSSNEYCRAIARKLQYCAAAKERFEGLDYKINVMIDALKSIKISKLSRIKNDNSINY